MSYLEYNFTLKPVNPTAEILMAELGNLGFESFVETETGLLAYIQEGDWHSDILDNLYVLKSNEFEVNYSIKEIAKVNCVIKSSLIDSFLAVEDPLISA